MKKVSVVVPCYNVTTCLGRCMDHLIGQTIGMENIEIILVNDASTDDGATWDLIMQYENRYPENIIAISLEENLRQGGARNVGVSYAGGEYLLFCDADDWLRLEALELLCAVMEESDADVVEFRYEKVAEYTGRQMPLKRGKGDYGMDNINDEIRRVLLLSSAEEFGLGCLTKMYRMSLVKEHNIRFAEHLIFEEPSFTFPVRLYETKHIFLDMVLYYYFQMPGSSMHGSLDNRKLDNANVWIILYEDLRERGFLERYPEELEYMFWNWGVGLTIRILLYRKYTLQAEELAFLQEMSLRYCPDIRHNPYLSKYVPEWNGILLEILDMEFTADKIEQFNWDALQYLTKSQ